MYISRLIIPPPPPHTPHTHTHTHTHTHIRPSIWWRRRPDATDPQRTTSTSCQVPRPHLRYTVHSIYIVLVLACLYMYKHFADQTCMCIYLCVVNAFLNSQMLHVCILASFPGSAPQLFIAQGTWCTFHHATCVTP